MTSYAAPYIGLPDPEKRKTPIEIMEQPETPPTVAERRGKAWYKKLSLSIKSNRKSNRSSNISGNPQTPVISKEEYLNKPLPPLPSPQQPPYFEYMFADAGVKKKKPKESMKSSAETDSDSQGKPTPVLTLNLLTNLLQTPISKKLFKLIPQTPTALLKATA